MENWGNWTFSKDNEHLLAETLNKFTTDHQSNLADTSKKVILSSLTNLSKTQIEISTSSSSDDSDIDIDSDFNTIVTCFPKFHKVKNDESVIKIDNEPKNIVSDITFDSEFSVQSQRPVLDNEDVTKVIIELLNAGKHNPQELYNLLKTKQTDQKNISEIIGDVWPEMVTEIARHNLCEALIKIDVKPHIICEEVYIPWFNICESNLTGFIESLSKLIIHFPEYACKSFLVKLLNDKNSILVKHLDWLSEIMKSLDHQHWCLLLSEYTKCCYSLDQHQILVLLHLVKNCQGGLNDNEAECLVVLCKNAVLEHSANRDFALFLMAVIGAINLTRFQSEITTISEQLKGASKFLIMKALKNAK